MMTNVVLLWQSFLTRGDHLLEWIERIMNSPLKILSEINEYDQEKVVIKLMRFSELEKRAFEKQRVRDRVEREAKSLIEATGNKNISTRFALLNGKWLSFRDYIRKERLRLDSICKIWREFQNTYQEIDHWINSCRINLQDDNSDLKSIDVIEKDLSTNQVSALSSSILLFISHFCSSFND